MPGSEPSRNSRACTSCFARSEEHTSELQSRLHLVCRLLLEKKTYITLSRRTYFSSLRPWMFAHAPLSPRYPADYASYHLPRIAGPGHRDSPTHRASIFLSLT